MTLNSNRLKPVIAVSILLVAGFLATSFFSYFVSRTSLRSEISQNELPLTGDNVYSEIQNDLLRPVFISSFMANDTFLRDWVINGEIGENRIVQYLKEVQIKYNTFTSFFVSEKTRIYYHPDGILKKLSPDEERDKWYFRVRKMKDLYEINVDPDLANKDAMTIFINFRVFDYDNNFIGATGVGLTVNAVKKLIETYQNKYNRKIFFVDPNGKIKLAGANFKNSTQDASPNNYFDRFKDRLDLNLEKSCSYSMGGHLIHANIRFIDEFGWYLVVEQSEQKTVAHIFKTLVINLAICILITIIVLFLINASVTKYQERIEKLRGIIPICSFCRQIRDDEGYWNQIEAYMEKYSDVDFSHSICPKCAKKHYPDLDIYDDKNV